MTLVVKCEDESVNCVFPIQVPQSFQDAEKNLLERKLKAPTPQQAASLLYDIYCSNEATHNGEAKFIKKKVINEALFVFNQNIWTPQDVQNPGVYVMRYSQGDNFSEVFTLSDLEVALRNAVVKQGVRFSRDGMIAFAPYSTMHLGTFHEEKLSDNGFVIASFGKEGAEKLDKVARTFNVMPSVWTKENRSSQHIYSITTLFRDWDDRDRLVVDGYDHGNAEGYAFGIN